MTAGALTKSRTEYKSEDMLPVIPYKYKANPLLRATIKKLNMVPNQAFWE
jgi:hypothetical protein